MCSELSLLFERTVDRLESAVKDGVVDAVNITTTFLGIDLQGFEERAQRSEGVLIQGWRVFSTQSVS